MELTLQSSADGGLTLVDPFPFEIGRDSDCDLWIGNDPEVSLLHARITRDGAGDCYLHDLEADNGTFLNEERVSTGQPKKLSQGDRLRFGSTEYTIKFADAPLERQQAAAAPSAAAAPEATGDGPPAGRPKRTPILIGLGVLAAAALVGIGFAVAGGSGTEEKKSTSEIVTEAKPSTVLVVSESDGQRNGNGSGWVYDADEGLIVTNAHVVDGSTDFEIGVDGDDQLRSATVVGVAPCDDLAVLKVNDTEGLRTMPLGSQADLEQGDRLLTIGYPGNGTTEDEIQVTDGVVSVVETRADEAALMDPDFAVYPNVIQTDAAINGGNSGGPSLSDDGKLIGVNTLGSTENQNQNFAIGVDRVKEVVPDLAAGRSLGWAGFGFTALTEQDLADEGLTGYGPGALVITSIAPGTGAEKQQLYVGDLVTRVSGTSVTTRRQYCSAVRDVESGDKVPVEFADSQSDYADYYVFDIPFE